MNILRNVKPVGVTSFLILPQNGVVDFGSGGSSPQTDRPPNIDKANGNNNNKYIIKKSSNNTSEQRPSALTVSSKIGYAQKIIRKDDSDNEDGFLPSTPEHDCDYDSDDSMLTPPDMKSELDISGSQAVYEALEEDTGQLMKRFLGQFTGLLNPRWKERNDLPTMKRVVDDVLEKNRYAYNGMINKLSLDDKGDEVRFVSTVANSLFADGTANWDRIARVVAFGAVVCQYLKEKGRENCVELVGEEISTYLLTDQKDWLVKNNSWDGFVEFFGAADRESTVRNTPMDSFDLLVWG
ncbi:induced myeloid leukemia cell differentiation protein Mcl-1 homolog [Thunnus albacares]|uniref:induced myeloid leukemia cell differentiation protein Mcl-1 homolog n=1 Tax=Thunnus albacares TaxID=8236 RepID=UPI001CF66CE3|nr:induced myeloid leukemia cell differentiation protein Mcl-1 homolog [Thunnus albacares]